MVSHRLLPVVATMMLGFCVIYVITRIMLLERRVSSLQSDKGSAPPPPEQRDISMDKINHMIKQQLEEAIDMALRTQNPAKTQHSPEPQQRPPPTSTFPLQQIPLPPMVSMMHVTPLSSPPSVSLMYDSCDVSNDGRIHEIPDSPTQKITPSHEDTAGTGGVESLDALDTGRAGAAVHLPEPDAEHSSSDASSVVADVEHSMDAINSGESVESDAMGEDAGVSEQKHGEEKEETLLTENIVERDPGVGKLLVKNKQRQSARLK